jgi:hypothetical protein
MLKLILISFAFAFSLMAQRDLTQAEIDARIVSFTIPINTAVTETVKSMPQNFGCIPAAIIMPPAWTTADIIVEFSLDGTTWYPLKDSMKQYDIIQADAGTWVFLDGAKYWTARIFRLKSVTVGTPGTPVNQAAARSVKVVCQK